MGRNPRESGLWIAGLAAIVLAGCAGPREKPLPICPGSSNAQEALQVLRARAKLAVSFATTGECRLAYHVPDEKGLKRQSLNLRPVWFQPPSDVFIQGGALGNENAVTVGSNNSEFWLAMRPKEISSYYWGRWDEAANAEGMLINPAVVLQAFGILGHEDPNAVWRFEKQGPYDVLTRLNAVGQPAQRLYIYTCDYLVHKIEHFGPEGHVVATAELKDFVPVTSTFRVPRQIHVTTIDRDGREDTIYIELNTIKEKTFTEAQRLRAFAQNLSETGRFDHVYQLRNGYWISQR